MTYSRLAPAAVAALFLCSACQRGGVARRPVGSLVKVLGSGEGRRLLTVKPLGGGRFLTLRSTSMSAPRSLFLEENGRSRLLADPSPRQARLTSPSRVVDGRVVIAAALPVTGEESENRCHTWWLGLDVATGRELFRSPLAWNGASPAALNFQVSPFSLDQRRGGAFAALVSSREGVKVLEYDARGEPTAEHVVIPAIPDSPRLALAPDAGKLKVLPTGELLVVTHLYQGEAAAYQRFSGVTLRGRLASPAEQLALIVKLTEDGRVAFGATLDLKDHSAEIVDVSLQGDLLAIAGNAYRPGGRSKAFVAVARLAPDASRVVAADAIIYQLSAQEDKIAGVAVLPDRRIIVAGNADVGQAASHSLVSIGKPFLSLVDDKAKELGFQWIRDREVEVVGEVVENGGTPLLIGHVNPPLTHGDGQGLRTAAFELRL